MFGLKETALVCPSCSASFPASQGGWESYNDHLDVCGGGPEDMKTLGRGRGEAAITWLDDLDGEEQEA